MPTYLQICPACPANGGQDVRLERVAPISACGDNPPCPCCGEPMGRDWSGERAGVAVASHGAYEACSGGAHEWEMDDAYRGDDGNWYRRKEDGVIKQLNPPGFDLNAKTGDVLIKNPGEKRRYIKTLSAGGVEHFDRS